MADYSFLGKYVFAVYIKSTKSQVKQAIELIFNVKVEKVNMINMDGKIKIFKGKSGKRSRYKKAIITTQDKKKIDFARGL